jgi:hypothetical protein
VADGVVQTGKSLLFWMLSGFYQDYRRWSAGHDGLRRNRITPNGQPVAAVDLTFESSLTATRLHRFVIPELEVGCG